MKGLSKKSKLLISFVIIAILAIPLVPYRGVSRFPALKSETNYLSSSSSQTGICRPERNVQIQWGSSDYSRIDDDVVAPEEGDGIKNSHAGWQESKFDIFDMDTILNVSYLKRITVYLLCTCQITTGGYAKLECGYRFGSLDWSTAKSVQSPFELDWISFTWDNIRADKYDLDAFQIKLGAIIDASGYGGWVGVDVMYAEIVYEPESPPPKNMETDLCRPNHNVQLQWDVSDYSRIDDDVVVPEEGDGIKNSHVGWQESKLDIFDMTSIDDVDDVIVIKIHLLCTCQITTGGYAKLECGYRFGAIGDWSTIKSIHSPFGLDWVTFTWSGLSVSQSDLDALQIRLGAIISASGYGGWVEVDVMYAEIIYKPSKICRPNGNIQNQWFDSDYTKINDDIQVPENGDGLYSYVYGYSEQKVDIFHMSTLNKAKDIRSITIHLLCECFITSGGYAKIECSYRFGSTGDWSTIKTIQSPFGMDWANLTWDGLNAYKSDLNELQIKLKGSIGATGAGGYVGVEAMYAEISYKTTRICRPNQNIQNQWDVSHFDNINDDVEKPDAGDGSRNSQYAFPSAQKTDIFGMTTIEDVEEVTSITVHLLCTCWISRGGYAKIECSYKFGGGSWSSVKTVGSQFGPAWKSFTWSGLSASKSQLDNLQIKLAAKIYATGFGGYVSVDVMYAEITYEHKHEEVLDWGVDYINAEKVWSPYEDVKDLFLDHYSGDGVKVLIIDSGLKYDHTDLDENYKYGIDFIDDDQYPVDGFGHGTHCAGIIAAEDNEWGVIGVSPKVKLYIARVFDNNGYVDDFPQDFVDAVQWGIEMNVDVISMSFGGIEDNSEIKNKLKEAYEARITLVAASGNYPQMPYEDQVYFPAAYPEVIAVGAIDENGNRVTKPPYTWASCYGPELDIVAPGLNIYSTYINTEGYDTKSGTSMACPMVAGVCILILSAKPYLTPNEVKWCLYNTTIDKGATGWDQYYGWGIVDAQEAVNYAINNF